MAETKDKVRVLFDTDADGYIVGYQQEFYDGKGWVAPFDTTNAIEVTPADLSGVTLGASKVSADGIITTDAAKQAEIEASLKAIHDQPTPAEQIESLKQENESLQSALLEISDYVLSRGNS